MIITTGISFLNKNLTMPLSAQVNCVPSNGDTNDNAVDINDGFFWYQAYRAYNENIDNYDLNADFDCSGEVDIIDGYIWYKAWKDPAVPTNTPIITNTTIPTITNQPSLLTLNLIPPNENLPIEIPRPNRLFDFACTTSQSTFPTTAETWIAQKSNDGINYCSPDTLTTSTSCSGANIQRHTPGMGICIWNSSTRKLRLDTNSATMPLNGCSINSNPWNVANPGGYSSQLVSDYTRKSQYLNSPSYELGKMSTLFLEFEFGIIEYTQSSCPPGVIDPITQTTTPVAQSMIGIMFNEVDLVTNATLSTVFYQLMLYDSRPEYRQYDSGRYIHCILPIAHPEEIHLS